MKGWISLLAAAVVTATGGSAAAETVAELNRPENWRDAKAFEVAGSGMKISVAKKISATSYIPVNPEKTYRFSMKVRRAPGSASSQFYAILEPVTEEGTRIAMSHVTAIRNSSGTLAAEVKDGDEFIIVKPDVKRNYTAGSGWVICFDAADDMSDLPNSKVSSVMKKVEPDGDNVKITFRSPLRLSAAAGTRVRIHASGSYIYTGAVNATGDEWTEVSGEVKGIAPGWSNRIFPVGTAGFYPAIMPNWNTKESTSVEIRDIRVEEL